MGIINRLMLGAPHLFGVLWDKSSSTVLTRTDDAVYFADPVPYLNNGDGSGPFDEFMPWKGMVKETFADGNVMVKIPRYWYKWTDDANGLKLQISDSPQAGFLVSPAHADRGDGKGQREFVYVGRYHCASDYKSKSGVQPVTNITLNTARNGCANLGAGYYLLDFAMWWTIQMLYLVEFADWNSQKVIGYGGGSSSGKQNSGYSNNAPYHTGTRQTKRTTYGVGIQYRHIEDPWANVRDWVDGVVINRGVYVTDDMSIYNDSGTNYTRVGDTATGSGDCISGWTVPNVAGLEWALWPKTKVTNTSYNTYIADKVYDGSVVPSVGGNGARTQGDGLFSIVTYSSSSTNDGIGARLQYLP